MNKKLLLILFAIACAACILGLAACNASITKITLDVKACMMNVGEMRKLTATVEPSDASAEDLIWESGDTSVLTVDNQGNVTAVGYGSSWITVYSQDRKQCDVCNISVERPYVAPEAEVEDITIHTGYQHTDTGEFPINVMLTEGDTDRLYGQIFFTVTGETAITWSAEPAGIVEVAAEGSYDTDSGNPSICALIKALKPGDATVTVSAGGKSDTCKVRVVAENYLRQLRFSCYVENDKYFVVDGLSDNVTAVSTPIDVVIPSELFGLPVAGIRADAFVDADNLKSVAIKDGVEYIGRNAFRNCQNLQSASLGEGLKKIDDGAFYGCEKLETVNIPESLEEMGSNVFGNCNALTIESVKCSASILGSLPTSKIRELTVTDGDELDLRSFGSLQKLTFGGSVKSILEAGYLPSSTEIHYNGTLSDWCATEGIGYLFAENTNENSVIAWKETQLSDGKLVIPEGTDKIANQAFMCFDGITEITIPASVKSIGYGILPWNPQLKLIVSFTGDVKDWCELQGILHLVNIGGQSLVETGGQIKVGGRELSGEIVIPAGTTRIGEGAFALSGITGVSIPATVKTIEEGAFVGSEITELNIPDGVETIGQLSGLNIHTLRLPATLTEKVTVFDCNELQSISFADGFDYDKIEVSNCPYKGEERGDGYYLGEKLTGIKPDAEMFIIPADCAAVDGNVFADVSNLRYLYVEGNGQTLLKDVRFNCPDLTVFGNKLPSNISNIKGKIALSDGCKCTDDGWIYKVAQYTYYDVISIQGYIGAGGEITVPAKIDNLSVRWIPLSPEYFRRDDITKIVITSSEFQVDGDGIFGMPNLVEIELADTVRELTVYAPRFTDCQNLARISLAGGYQNYVIAKKANPTAEVAETVTPTDAADAFAQIKESTYKVFTIKKAS